MPNPRRKFVLSQKKLALFCDNAPEAPANKTEPCVAPVIVEPMEVLEEIVTSPRPSDGETATFVPAITLETPLIPALIGYAT